MVNHLSFTGQSGCYGELALSVLAGATTFTIEVKMSTTSTKNNTNNWTWGTIAGCEIDNHWQDDFGLCVNNGKLCFWAEPKNDGSSSTCNTMTNAVINDGNIHRVAVVSSNGAIDLYCDGINVAHTDNVNAKITSTKNILLGYDSNPNSYLQMDLYEARFWSVARTQADIFADIDGTERGLECWLKPTANGLLDYSGNDRHATLYGSPAYFDTLSLTLNNDTAVTIKNTPKLREALKVWLPFNESTTQDLCGNSWTAYGTPTIAEGALQLDGASYIEADVAPLSLLNSDFTIHFYLTYKDSKTSEGGFFTCASQFALQCYNSQARFNAKCTINGVSRWLEINITPLSTFKNTRHHFAIVRKDDTLYLFFDGQLKQTLTVGTFTLYSNISGSDGILQIGKRGSNLTEMTIDEFMIYSEALWTEDFTPPIADDYIALAFELYGQAHIFLDFDVKRNLTKTINFDVDLLRRVGIIFEGLIDFDTKRNVTRSLNFIAEGERIIRRSEILDLDVARHVNLEVDIFADAIRNIVATLNLFQTDNSDYLPDNNQAAEPVIIPSQQVQLSADDTKGITSFEISLSEQQLTDQVKVTSVIPLQLLQAVKGQYLDYLYDMRVEKVSRQGILYSADCFINIDEILYTPLNYDMPAITYQLIYLENQAYDKALYPLASRHVTEIATALGLEAVMQFEDFYSTVEVNAEKENGGTYADLVRNIFGWSSRVPTQLINSYIRNGKLFVIQRGHEAHVIDISAADMTMPPTITHELFRIFYQRQKFSRTETFEVKRRKINHVNRSSEIHASENSASNYSYNNSGLLDHSVTTTTNSSGEEVRTETDYDYRTLDSGEKVLVKETTKKYVNGSLDETTETKHTPLRQGLSHQITTDSDGDIISEGVGQNSADDRVSPYSEFRDDNTDWEVVQEYLYNEGLSLIDTSFPIQNVIRENFTNSPYPILGLTEEERFSVDTAKGHGRLKAITEELKRLNLTTKETVNVTIYNFPHLIDFNDRVILNGIEYFLVSNNAKTVPRLFNSQSLTLVRWIPKWQILLT